MHTSMAATGLSTENYQKSPYTSQPKYENLVTLCNMKIIPSDHHAIYKALPFVTTGDDGEEDGSKRKINRLLSSTYNIVIWFSFVSLGFLF